MFAPVHMVVAGVVAAVVAAAVTVIVVRGGSTVAPVASPSAVGSRSAATSALSSYDWGAVTFPRAACDPHATGEETLTHGRGGFTVGAQAYSVSTGPKPTYGKLDGRQVAALQLGCFLVGANGAGTVLIALYVGNGDDVQRVGVVRTLDLGTAPQTTSALVPSSMRFVEGQLVIVGAYLHGGDGRCCPSGTGWTTVRWQEGALVPSGVITEGKPPATLPTASANLTTYPGDGVTVRAAADLPKLVGAPDDFKKFVLTQVPPAEAPCNEPGTVTVRAIRSDGYAVGDAVYHCKTAGHGVLWAKSDGAWRKVAASEEAIGCALLQAATFPAALLGPDPMCADEHGAVVPYDDGTPSPSPTAEVLPSTTNGAPPPGVQLVDYRDADGNGTLVTSEADVEKLNDAPDDFKAFIRSEYQKLAAVAGGPVSGPCRPSIGVYALRTDGFAIGEVGACGGSLELWAKVGGSWKAVLGMQDYPYCRDLRRLEFPPEVFDKGPFVQCLKDDGRAVAYAN